VAGQPLNILSTGDSWFDYPLDGPLPGQTDIIAQLPALLNPQPQILNLAHYGLATTTLLGTAKREMLVEQLNDADNGKFDAILFSGGGNDLAGDLFRFWIRSTLQENDDPATATNQATFADIIGIVTAAYEDLVSIRDAYNLAVPIFVHGYDFAIPDGRPAYCLGPWLYPSLKDRGWMTGLTPADLARGGAVVKALLVQFNQMLVGLAGRYANIVVVPTQGTLAAESDWANELHPTPAGFGQMAAKFAAALQSRFPGRS